MNKISLAEIEMINRIIPKLKKDNIWSEKCNEKHQKQN